MKDKTNVTAEPVRESSNRNNGSSYHRDSLEMTTVERELFDWFENDPKNTKKYIDDPIGTLKEVTSASEGLIQSLQEIASMIQDGMPFDQDNENFTILPQQEYHLPDSNIGTTAKSSTWETSLPHTGSNVISVLSYKEYLYAAGNGYLYQLDGQTGKILQSNDLPKRGKHEIRMTISSDGKTLYLGTDGYAIGIETAQLTTLWQASLKHTGSNVISVLLDKDVLYAAGNGYVYQLEAASGHQIHSNDLPKRGKHEIRLALSKKRNVLYVGTDGYVVAMASSDLKTQWQTSLDHTGSSAVSLVVDENNIYAGSHGYVYMLDADGNVLHHNDLPDRGSHDVRMTIGKANGEDQLFVGTDGSALCLSLSDLTTEWQTSLPHTKDNVVNLLVGNNTLYAGSYGFVYQLKPSTGKVFYCNNLPDRGNHEVRLALAKGNAELYAGTEGYALGLPSCGDLAAGWDMVGVFKKEFTNNFLDKKVNDSHSSSNAQTIAGIQVVNGAVDTLQVKIKLQSEFSAGGTIFKKVSGHVTAKVDLTKLQGELQARAESGENGYTLHLHPQSDDLLSHIALDQLTFEVAGQQTNRDQEVKDKLESMLNAKVALVLPDEIALNLPLSIGNLRKYVRFTFVNADDGESYLALMVMVTQQPGNYHLSPEIVSNPKNTSASFILSNGLIMEAIDKIMNAGDIPFSLSNDYPTVLRNDHEIPIPGKYTFGLHINEHDFEIYFEDNKLKVKIEVKYWGALTLWIHKSAYLYLDFDTVVDDNGQIVITGKGTSKIPWTSFISPIPIVGIILGVILQIASPKIKEHLDKLFGDGLSIKIPGFAANFIDTPAYVQIGGNWESGDSRSADQVI